MKKLIIFISLLFFAFCSCDSQRDNLPNVVPKAKKISEDVIFNTDDNVKIYGTYYYNNIEMSKKEPLVILIHQFMSDRGQWKMDFIDSLVAKKYKVITYDIRNHGESDKAFENTDEILTQKGNAYLDLKAVINWAKERNGIDSTRIAVVGTSVGASLGLYAQYYLGTKTTVCISVGKNTFFALTGINELSMSESVTRKINTVFFICGDRDDKYPDDAKDIYSNYVDDPKDLKYFSSDKHGKDLIMQYPEINKMIIDWLVKYL